MSSTGLGLLVFAIATAVGGCSYSNEEWATAGACASGNPYECGAAQIPAEKARELRKVRESEKSTRQLLQQKGLAWTAMNRAVTLANADAQSAEPAGSRLSALVGDWCSPSFDDLYDAQNAIAIRAVGDDRITITYLADPDLKPRVHTATYTAIIPGRADVPRRPHPEESPAQVFAEIRSGLRRERFFAW